MRKIHAPSMPELLILIAVVFLLFLSSYFDIYMTGCEHPENSCTDQPETVRQQITVGFITATPDPNTTPAVRLIPATPDARLSKFDIIEVFSVGDVTAEGVKIRNSGNTVDVTGWTLTNADGNEYTFRAEQLIFSQTEVTIYTRAGQDTPIALFWGLDTPVWAEGDIVTLLDAGG